MDPNQSLPSPRKRPKQARSRLLYNSIIETCKKIILTESVEKLTLAHVSDVCGISVGSFYQYFPNIEAVLTEIYMEDMPTTHGIMKLLTNAIKSGSTLEESLRAAIELGLRFHGERLNFNMPYYQKYHLYYHLMDRNKNKELFEQSCAAYRELLERYKDSRGITDTDMKAFILMECLSVTIHSTIDARPEHWNDKEFEDLLLRISVAIIQPQIND